MEIRKKFKKFFNKIIDPLCKVSYINNSIYEGNLLKSRTALITGGSSGIGLAIAKRFYENGANVIIVSRNKSKLESAINEIKKSNSKFNNYIIYHVMDLLNINDLEKEFDNILKNKNIDAIDILVNNAGVILGENIPNTSIDDFEKCLKTNLESVYFLSQYAYRYMKSKKIKGNILNILSSSTLRPAVKPYTLSKWGLKGLTIGMAKKFIESEIVVNGLAPGPCYTPMLVDDMKEKNIKLKNNPSGRFVTPEEIANGALFLVSDMGRMIVGDIMYMTGGAGIVTVDDIGY